MGVHERTVKVNGELGEIYRSLVTLLASNRYEITSQSPPSQIAASRGSKVVTLALGTADYEELNVTLFPAGSGSVEVQFHFTFPWKSLLFLTPSERRKHEEGDHMIDTFVRLVETSHPVSGAMRSTVLHTRACPECGAPNTPHGSFCTSCGSALAPAQNPAGVAGSCPACSGKLEGSVLFCPFCGHRLHGS